MPGLSFVNIAAAVLLAIAIWRFIHWLTKMIAYRRLFHSCPGPEDYHWLYGNLHEYPGPNEAGLAYQQELTVKCPYYHRLWAGPFIPVLILHHPQVIRILLKSSAPKPRALPYGASAYEMGIRWLGEGLLIANGQKWHRNRHLLTPAFHFDILQPYSTVINKAADVLVSKIDSSVKQDGRFEVFNLVTLCSLDIILQCAFSYVSKCQIQGDKHPYVQAVTELGDLWIERSLNPLVFFDGIFFRTSKGKRFLQHCDYVHSVAEEIITKRRLTLEQNAKETTHENGNPTPRRKYLDFLDILLTARDEDGRGMTDLEIRNEVDTFLFEGHDTTTSATSWILYSLAQHPDIQRRVQEEIDEVMQDKEEVSWSDLAKLEYLSLCVKEGLRLHSPVPFIERQITEEVEMMGKKIPAGTLMAVQIYEMHHNPAVWPDHNKYIPERFHQDNILNKDPFSFLPFSAGSRNCIGQNFAMMEIKTLIVRILHKFNIELDPKHPAKKKVGLVMKAENGIQMFAYPRNGKS